MTGSPPPGGTSREEEGRRSCHSVLQGVEGWSLLPCSRVSEQTPSLVYNYAYNEAGSLYLRVGTFLDYFPGSFGKSLENWDFW